MRKNHNFVPYRLAGIPSSVKKDTESGAVIIDFASRQNPFPFGGRDELLDFSILDGNTETRLIRESIEMPVPNRATLLILKLKAIWDRQCRIEQQTSDNTEWEKGKLIKDHADVLALIDPNYGGNEIEISVLGKLLAMYPFLEKSLTSVYGSDDGVTKYGRMSQDDAKLTIDQILSLIH